MLELTWVELGTSGLRSTMQGNLFVAKELWKGTSEDKVHKENT